MPRINYAAGLLCDSPEIVVLEQETFEAMVSRRRGGVEFKWTDGLVFPDGLEKAPEAPPGYDPAIIDKLVVCDMGPLGLGVFANSFIPKGTPITCYSGVVTSEPKAGDLYNIGLEDGRIVTARQRGNLTGLIQHMGDPTSLKHYVEEIGLANLSAQRTSDGAIWFIAARDIHPKEQLGFTYDQGLGSYWEKIGMLPKEFDRFGRVLPYTGGIFIPHIKPLLICLALALKDIERLEELKTSNEASYSRTIEEISAVSDNLKTGILAYLVSHLFKSHIDILKLLHPADRKALLKFLEANSPIMDPAGFEYDNPYTKNQVLHYVEWKEVKKSPGFFPSSAKMAVLKLPEDFFNIVNPLRYYTPPKHSHLHLKDISTKVEILSSAGGTSFKHKKFAEAAVLWEEALMLARDKASIQHFAVGDSTPSADFLLDDKKRFIFFDATVLSLCWNLGNAYFQAATQKAAYKHEYLREANVCLEACVAMVKVSDAAVQESLLEKYQSRLETVQAEIDKAALVSDHVYIVAAAAGGAAGGAGRR
jgi:hypothetical protein